MGWLIGLLSALADFALKLWRGRGPSQEQQEAEKAGAAQVDATVAEQDAGAAESEVAAEANAPKTLGDVASELDKDKF